MAFGIDDALTTAAAGISLTDTIVQTITRYRQEKQDYDLELLLEEVRITALRRINDADLALKQFEEMLEAKGVDPNRRLEDIIAGTSIWKPFEQHRLTQIQKRFREFSDSIYCGIDDIAALARCRDRTKELGSAVVDSTKTKRELQMNLMGAKSLKDAIALLRNQLDKHKAALTA